MALPEELVSTFTYARSIMDGHTPQILQLTLARFMDDGHYNSHVRAMRKLYAGRREVILNAISKHLDGIVTVVRPEGGLQIPCLLTPEWSEQTTIRRAAVAGVLLPSCQDPCHHIPVRSWPLFKARALLHAAIESFNQEQKP